MNNKIYGIFVAILIVALGAEAAGANVYFKKQQKSFDSKVAVLQKQISNLSTDVAKVTGQQPNAALTPAEVANREALLAKSQQDLLTSAVAKTTPAVVSVVISKDVPKLKVVYQNPFGDDPFFQNLGFQVPVYQQDGVQHQQVGAGTGFLITSDGYILTNKHVVADDQADYTVLLSNGKQQSAKVMYKDPQNDVAIIKIDGSGLPAVTFGDSASLKLAQTVVAIGNALGQYNNSVSVGVISGLDRSITASSGDGSSEQLSGVIQTDAAINPGNSGGPLLNLDGQVVGINVATVTGSNSISFSIPINTVKTILKAVLHV